MCTGFSKLTTPFVPESTWGATTIAIPARLTGYPTIATSTAGARHLLRARNIGTGMTKDTGQVGSAYRYATGGLRGRLEQFLFSIRLVGNLAGFSLFLPEELVTKERRIR